MALQFWFDVVDVTTDELIFDHVSGEVVAEWILDEVAHTCNTPDEYATATALYYACMHDALTIEIWASAEKQLKLDVNMLTRI